jgi:hypothetical protein
MLSKAASYPLLFAQTLVLLSTVGCSLMSADDRPQVTVTRHDGKLSVAFQNRLFTEYVYEGNNKPILYPVIGPHGSGMTRNYPMMPVEGEANDHVHHRSLWFTHGRVNGIDFWLERETSGQIVHQEFLEVSGGETGLIVSKNKWLGPDGKLVCSDTRRLTFAQLENAMQLDYEVTVFADVGPVTFGDTKEGTMAVRTHPNLRLKNDDKRGVTTANGKALNSEGDRDKELWGKRAKWVDYWGEIDGQVVGIAIFDHPSNPRHPTWWHARDYGLVAANAFGIHNFERKPKGTGDFTIPAGESTTFRYRFLFHKGDPEEAAIAEQYEKYAAKKP